MQEKIKVAFASARDDLNRGLIERMEALFPELPLYVVSEFPPDRGRWVPYHVSQSLTENLARCRAAWKGKKVRLAGVLLVPRMPYRRMRLIALLVSPIGFLAFNEHFGSFMLRPRCAGTIVRHVRWRIRNYLHWQFHLGGDVYAFFWRLARPAEWRLPLLVATAAVAGRLTQLVKAMAPPRRIAEDSAALEEGISVVIPSRNGRDLLAQMLGGVLRELEGHPSEVIVVDNGSDDGTAGFLRRMFPAVGLESSDEPLSFARAVNHGIRAARFSHVCLLNNDMTIEREFFGALRAAFDAVPDLFCSTAQIFHPPGARREETGKAVMARSGPEDFPIRCEVPLAGEDLTYVLYGSGGCSLYDARKLRALGGLREAYEPAYVEDLDLGYRAWVRGWPSVYAASARVEHRHRATTSRYYSEQQLAAVLERNYLRFLAGAVHSPRLFRQLWGEAIRRLYLLARGGNPAAREALHLAPRAPLLVERPPAGASDEADFLALTCGDAAVFPGRPRTGRPVILIASPYLPFPLSHGGAVRMYNLMRRAAAGYDQVLVAFSTQWEPPAAELLEICVEVVLVRLVGSHSRPSTARPNVVEEFDSLSFHAALRETMRKWRPALVQLEFTQMAQYAPDCAPAPAILVEHDVTFDLYEQLLALHDDWDLRCQLDRWRRFETAAWRRMSCVVAMSEKDRRVVRGARAVTLPNGVDLDRFRPSTREPEPGRLLFIGSLAHLPNVLALEFFLHQVWPLLEPVRPTLHVIAGQRHEYFLDRYRDRAQVNLAQPGIEVEGFVADVRAAYQRAALVVAPLVASAGTNIKVLEAMAMGKAIVSTPPGVNGLDLEWGRDVVVTERAAGMAAAIGELLASPARRRELEREARATVEKRFSWDVVAAEQAKLYDSVRAL